MLSEEKRIACMNPPAGRLRLAIDTDTMNEVDDQFAIAWAAASKDRFDLEALYAAPFSHDCFSALNEDEALVAAAGEANGHSEDPADGMEQSYQEIIRILGMMNEPTEGRVFRGSGRYLPDRETPVDSPAVRDLIHRAMNGSGMLYVAAIATLTNIASAILLEPAITEHMTVVWLGGHQLSCGHGIEFNLIQDVYAAQVVLNSGVPMIWVPCNNVAALLTVTESELRTFMENNGTISDYLAKTVLNKFLVP